MINILNKQIYTKVVFKKVIYIFVVLFLRVNIIAHPHVFISPEVCLIMNGRILEKIEVKWVFDRMTSISMIKHMDKDNDGVLDAEKIEKISKEVFPALSQ